MAKRVVGTLALVGLLALVGCARDRSGGEVAAAAQGTVARPMPALQERVVVVVAEDYRFRPARITVKRGTAVTIRLENRGTEPHEFEIEPLDLEIGRIEPGQVAQQTFVADRAGLFTYECHVDDHLQQGMRGTLEVVE